MAPKSAKKKRPHSPDTDGIFHGMVVFLVPKGIQLRRLQVWKQKLEQMSATIEDELSERVTHVFAADSNVLFQQVNRECLKHFKGSLLSYQWLENCLKLGERLPEDQYILKPESAEDKCSGDKSPCPSRNRVSFEGSKAARAEGRSDNEEMAGLGNSARPENQSTHSKELSENCAGSPSSVDSDPAASEALQGADASQLSSLYNPPNLNKNITEIFDKLINIYRALGDDRRSFSYYKAISVIEKLPFKIENVHQVKNLPAIGKSMQDHVEWKLKPNHESKVTPTYLDIHLTLIPMIVAFSIAFHY